MLNQVIMVGRLVAKPIVEENENGRKVSEITLAIPRSYRNDEGLYDTDFIKCILWNSIAENTAEYCKKGDIVAVKGRLQCLSGSELQLVAEKITFLTNNKTNNDKEEE